MIRRSLGKRQSTRDKTDGFSSIGTLLLTQMQTTEAMFTNAEGEVQSNKRFVIRREETRYNKQE